jgi:lipid II:glycine glycyltransferase (peptidoglycan interpeptide bridge formation enzyme)
MHFLQSEAWEAFQQSLGRKTFRREGEGWNYLAILETGGIGTTRLYCPYGPTAESPRALQTALESLKALATSQKVTSLRIQPTGIHFKQADLIKLGLKPIDYSQPSHTWHIDLTKSREALIADMNQNNRSIIRNYTKKGLSYERSHDPEDVSRLTSLLHQVANRNKITIHSDDYLKDQATSLIANNAASLHFINLEDKTIAAALVYEDPTTYYYAHAAADHEHRKLNASTALLGEIILDAKAKNKKICDLYGITDSADPDHRWAGFTKFKKSFGGHAVTYSDTYELPVRKLHFAMYTTLRSLQKLLLK